MRNPRPSPFFCLLGMLFLGLSVGCKPKPSEAVVQAQDAAKAADERVAQLEKERADIKAGKVTPAGDPDVVEHTTQAQLKALDRRLAEARKNASTRHHEAETMASAPPSEVPRTVTLTVPAQTPLAVALSQELATDKVQAGDGWDGVLAEDVVVAGQVAWPKGTPVRGVVAQSVAAGRLKSGQGGLGIRLSAVGGTDVEAGTYLVAGGSRGERDAQFIGGTAALGALVGVLSSKHHQADHALGGAAIGAAAGTGLAAGTADTVIRIPAGKPVTFTLAQPEKVILR